MKRWRSILSAALLAAAGGGLLALPSAAPAVAQAPAPTAPAWTVDRTASSIGFETSYGIEHVEAFWRTWSAEIAFDPKNLAGSQVTVSVDTGSISTGEPNFDGGIAGSQWFNATAFPKATFTSKAFRDLGGGRYEADAELSVRGVAMAVVMPFTLEIEGDKAVMTAELPVERLAFGVGTEGTNVPHDTVIKTKVTASRRPG